MAISFGFLRTLFSRTSAEDKELASSIERITGRAPRNLALYKLAIRHASAGGTGQKQEHNERLEFLGDAVLGIIVAHYLYRRFPYKNEGFLTEIRSRIVNGDSLNDLAGKIGLDKLIKYEGRRKQQHTHRSMFGDAMEALVGAFYLDYGFEPCQQFVTDRLLKPHYDLEKVVDSETNHKSRLIEFAQRNGYTLRFDIIKEVGRNDAREFVAQVSLNGKPFATGQGYNKKKADQAAALKALDRLNQGRLPGDDADQRNPRGRREGDRDARENRESEDREPRSYADRANRNDRAERMERSDSPERPDRLDRPEQSQRPERTERPERPQREERPDRNNRNRNPRPERDGQTESSEPNVDREPASRSPQPESQERNNRSRPPRRTEPPESDAEQTEPTAEVPQMRPSAAPRNTRNRQNTEPGTDQPRQQPTSLPETDNESDNNKEAPLGYEQALNEAMKLQSDVDDFHGPTAEKQSNAPAERPQGRSPRPPRPPRPPRGQKPDDTQEATFPLEPTPQAAAQPRLADDWVIDEPQSSIERRQQQEAAEPQTSLAEDDATQRTSFTTAESQEEAPMDDHNDSSAQQTGPQPTQPEAATGADAVQIAALRANYRAQAQTKAKKWINVTGNSPAAQTETTAQADLQPADNWVEQSRQDFQNQTAASDFDQIASQAEKSFSAPEPETDKDNLPPA